MQSQKKDMDSLYLSVGICIGCNAISRHKTDMQAYIAPAGQDSKEEEEQQEA